MHDITFDFQFDDAIFCRVCRGSSAAIQSNPPRKSTTTLTKLRLTFLISGMNSAVVNPERPPASERAEHAGQPAAQPAGARAIAKAVSTFGRIVEQCSKLYGYGLLIAGIDSLFLAGVSSLPLTKWDDEKGVPRADAFAVSALL